LFLQPAPQPPVIGKELGLTDPFEADAPVHLKYSTDLRQMPQAPSSPAPP
jgi:hypothetical protein